MVAPIDRLNALRGLSKKDRANAMKQAHRLLRELQQFEAAQEPDDLVCLMETAFVLAGGAVPPVLPMIEIRQGRVGLHLLNVSDRVVQIESDCKRQEWLFTFEDGLQEVSYELSGEIHDHPPGHAWCMDIHEARVVIPKAIVKGTQVLLYLRYVCEGREFCERCRVMVV